LTACNLEEVTVAVGICMHTYIYFAPHDDCITSFCCHQELGNSSSLAKRGRRGNAWAARFVTKIASYAAIPGPAYGCKLLTCKQMAGFREEYRLFFFPRSEALALFFASSSNCGEKQ